MFIDFDVVCIFFVVRLVIKLFLVFVRLVEASSSFFAVCLKVLCFFVMILFLVLVLVLFELEDELFVEFVCLFVLILFRRGCVFVISVKFGRIRRNFFSYLVDIFGCVWCVMCYIVLNWVEVEKFCVIVMVWLRFSIVCY